MQHHMRWMIVGPVVVAALLLAACGGTAPTATKAEEPAHVEPIEGSDLSRVVLAAEAIKRLDIQTVAVRDEQVMRKRTVGGEVMDLPATGTPAAVKTARAAGAKLVRVPLTESDLGMVEREQSVTILPLAKTSTAASVVAKPIDAAAVGKADDNGKALYFVADGAEQALQTGHRVRVEVTLAGSGTQRTVIPYGSIIYDLDGNTWVYTSTEPGAYVRKQVFVDYIDQDKAILSQGLPAGTEIVSVGAAELYGTEFGVGH